MMSIKQQKDIRKFLEGEYPFDTAAQIYKKQEDSLMAMLETVKNESKSRYKTLKQTILPRIATKHPSKGQRLLRYNYYEMSVARCLCQI